MSEKFSEGKGSAPENLEEQKYKDLQAAMDEENRIMKEINDVFASGLDRVEAERIVLEQYASLMDEAIKKSSETLKAWLDSMQESKRRTIKEADDTEDEEERREE